MQEAVNEATARKIDTTRKTLNPTNCQDSSSSSSDDDYSCSSKSYAGASSRAVALAQKCVKQARRM